MTNQEIYNRLSELEHEMWKKAYRDGDREKLSEQQVFNIHNLMRQTLIEMNMYYKQSE